MAGLPKRIIRNPPGPIEVAFRTMFAVLAITVALVVGGLLGGIAYAFQVVMRGIRRILGIFR